MGAPISVTETITPRATDNQQAGYKGYINGVLSIDIASVTLAQARVSCETNTRNNAGSMVRCTWNDRDINTYPLDVSYTTTRMVPNIIGYTLTYRKDVHTLEEAKNKIEANDVYITKTTGPNEGVLNIPTTSTMGYLARSEVAAALSNLRDIRTAL